MGTEKFCLKWNDFESNISGAFKDIRDAKDFFDVTLACDDDQLQAHKVILSACSPFFRNILKRNPHQHPLLYLKGVKYSDLQSVLNFMYHGEVNVAQDELNSFLAVAEELRVKGLTQNNGSQSANTKSSSSSSSHHQAPKSPTPSKSSRPSDRESAPPPKRPRPAPAPIAPPPPLHDDDDIQEVVPVKSEPRDTSSAVIANTSNDMYQAAPSNQQTMALAAEDDISYGADESYDDYGSYDQEGYDGQMMDPNMAGGADGNKEITTYEDFNAYVKKGGQDQFECSLCYKTFKQRRNARNHVESIHFPNHFEHHCSFCGKMFSSSNNLRVHITRQHNADNA